MRQGCGQVWYMVQRGRAEDQVESLGIVKGPQVLDTILDVRPRSPEAGDRDQRLADIDANHLVKALRQDDREAPGTASEINRTASILRQ